MDIKLNYIQKGAGETLILLHGNGENSDYFKNQIEYFSKNYNVLAIDSRGHGKTSIGTKPFTLSQFADDLKNFLDNRSLTSVNILGFSDGANMALIFALRYPMYAKRLILNGANLYPSGVKLKHNIPTYFSYLFSPLEHKKKLMKLMISEPNLNSSQLHNITNDTLVIAGKFDMIKESHTKLIANSLPNSTLKIIDGDHFIAQSNALVFNSVVEDFLKKH